MAAAKKEPAKPTQAASKSAPAPKSAPPATTKKMEVSTEVHDYGTMAGGGFEGTTQEDFTMPFLNLLQLTSPEVGAEGPEKAIEGAKPGMLMNSVTKELFDPKDGVIFVPVTTQHVYVEWRKRDAGGGLVGRHEIDSEVVKSVKAAAEKFGEYETEDGNDLVETFYMIGYTLADEDAIEPKDILVLSFSSTKIKVYKRIMQMLRTATVPGPNGVKMTPPLFSNRLRVGSVPEKNNHGAFWNFDLRPIHGNLGPSRIPPTLDDQVHPLLVFGQHLGEQVRSGTRKMADESTGQEGTGGDGDEGEGKTPF